MSRLHHLFLASSLAFTASAWALPGTTIDWVQREGTTSGSEAVEVWLRLSVAAEADGPLVMDGSAISFSDEDLMGFNTVDTVSRSAWATCSGTFWPQPPLASCFDDASPWRFEFSFDTETSFIASGPVTLAPGESREYLHGTFTPQNGPVAPGTYTFGGGGFSLEVYGTDIDGEPLSRYFELGSPCSYGDTACYFTRVVEVPEPASYGLMALGLGVVGWLARRRRPALGGGGAPGAPH